ncbi:hypothetical protein PR048_019366 [Dryococelus australis]|uniref:Integrase catalytic domain-containing protein n=1 Tax=Dryococelus australis TaxID=614101 RepID=A0ABQ9H3D3_9NEOP|nr:hypothetical protein PR048_019366 [Dryococelus australis]
MIELSTAAFMAALKCFVSWRGRSREIFSDCGTYFVCAARELKELFTLVQSENLQQIVYLAHQGISWYFNSPAAPHQGGLWEAGVKSIKYHLYCVVSYVTLNFEEFYTVLTMIEACLNSRPLIALSSDPWDLSALTPGHFLIGDSLIAIPEAGEPFGKLNDVARWQLVQQLVKHFWWCWSSEFLTRLQNRRKWWIKKENLHIGDMVILKDEQLPAQQWNIGRIVNTFPGVDGLVRTATVKTASGEFKRPVVTIVPLPF